MADTLTAGSSKDSGAGATDAPKAGALLAGKYRVDRVLGCGGMGIVVLATHVVLQQRVAIKRLRHGWVREPSWIERFKREARAAAMLRSEHVVRVHDIGVLDDGAPYMVMEYLEGVDLAELIEADGPLEVATAVDYVLQACAAIAEAHAHGIIHRDLKPANLFLARRRAGAPRVKVLDFGISKVAPACVRGVAPLTDASDVLGSPGFMSPEQMRSSRDVDQRADIWALGAILFELLTARRAFAAKTIPELYLVFEAHTPPAVTSLRPEVPLWLSDVVGRCLEKDPRRRFQSVDDLAAALQQRAPRPGAYHAARPSEPSPHPRTLASEGGPPRASRRSSGWRRASWGLVPIASVIGAAVAITVPSSRANGTDAAPLRALATIAFHDVAATSLLTQATASASAPVAVTSSASISESTTSVPALLQLRANDVPRTVKDVGLKRPPSPLPPMDEFGSRK